VARKAPAKKVADPTTAYAQAVVAGKIVAGRPVRLACERHLRDLKRKDLAWRPEKAADVFDFFRTLLTLEDGSPFALLPFQQFIIGCVFGWYASDGTRRFRTAYVETGKGSGKTPLAAGVGLYGLIGDGEPAPEIYSAATDREQAKIAWRDAARMVEGEAELKELVSVQVGSLTIPSKSATFRPVSSEHKGLDGLRPHIGLVDELHEHPTGLVVDKIRAGIKRRRNALIFEITNSGWDRTSVCWAHHGYSLRVLEGTLANDSWFAYVAALDEGDDWADPKVWLKANPGMEAGLPPAKYLAEQVREAQGMPSKENIVRRLNFCQWTEQNERWLPMPMWDQSGQPFSEAEVFAGRTLYAGLDLGSTSDMTALTLWCPDEDGGGWATWRFWVPEDAVEERQRRGLTDYADWVKAGHLKTTPGNVTDYDFIEHEVLELFRAHDIRALAFDRWNSTQVVVHLRDELGDRVVEFGQGFASMSGPSKELERLVMGRLLRHGGNPVARWMAGNVCAKTDPAGNIKPDKERSAEKIDGIVTLVMSLGVAQVATVPAGPSVYESRGLAVI
jgi:phage terminase large subunit-like protein